MEGSKEIVNILNIAMGNVFWVVFQTTQRGSFDASAPIYDCIQS